MPTFPSIKKPQTLAGTILPPTDSHMIQLAQAEFVNGETAAADLARDFVQRIETGVFADSDPEDTNAVDVRGPD